MTVSGIQDNKTVSINTPIEDPFHDLSRAKDLVSLSALN